MMNESRFADPNKSFAPDMERFSRTAKGSGRTGSPEVCAASQATMTIRDKSGMILAGSVVEFKPVVNNRNHMVPIDLYVDTTGKAHTAHIKGVWGDVSIPCTMSIPLVDEHFCMSSVYVRAGDIISISAFSLGFSL